ncbi:MAG TPA: biotin--[acetyl-CoA-carboxylase] ligase [Bryobacteraceae bacterium]|nr:biotin--[acetyl-CoA-carboxylase] ligase [Bryobacteraceae bacterium]
MTADRRVIWLERCESTMIEAAVLAAEGAPHGTVVGADEQTAGQGRLGRAWHSEPGAGLYVSMVLRLPQAGLLTMALGLATAEAIGVPCDLRWPNDVLIGRKKCAGILVMTEHGAFIAGIGINLNHTSFPPDLAEIATSLRIETGREQSRAVILDALLAAVDRWLAADRETILEEFARRSSWVRGKRVVVEGVRGVTDGLDDRGFLWLRLDDGTRHRILAGGVREE